METLIKAHDDDEDDKQGEMSEWAKNRGQLWEEWERCEEK